MTTEYTYSIIIPHKDIPDLLDRLLSTVPHRKDTQVIVCDDCSTRENYELVQELKNKYPQIEIYQTDSCSGGGRARNLGLKYAKGKYLIFADADDYFNICFPNILDKYARTCYDIIYFSANSVDCETYQNSYRGELTSKVINLAFSQNNFDSLRYKLTIPWAKFISKRMVDENRIFFQESPISNDVLFSYLVDFYAKAIFADKTSIYCVTTRANSTSYTISWERLQTRLKINLDKCRFMRDQAMLQPDVILMEWDFNTIITQYPGYKTDYKNLLMEYGFSKRQIKRFFLTYYFEEFRHQLVILKNHMLKICNLIKF